MKICLWGPSLTPYSTPLCACWSSRSVMKWRHTSLNNEKDLVKINIVFAVTKPCKIDTLIIPYYIPHVLKCGKNKYWVTFPEQNNQLLIYYLKLSWIFWLILWFALLCFVFLISSSQNFKFKSTNLITFFKYQLKDRGWGFGLKKILERKEGSEKLIFRIVKISSGLKTFILLKNAFFKEVFPKILW